MEENITINYKSDRRAIVDWLDKIIREASEKEGYDFIGSGVFLPTGERDISIKSKNYPSDNKNL